MSYQDTISYLESFVNYERKTRYPYKESFKLERMKDFLRRLDDPHRGLRYIHVAGTKGKGSVCVFAASILRAAGYRVGLYTSPHLGDVRERIRVLQPAGPRSTQTVARGSDRDFEGMIPRKDLSRLVDALRPEADAFDRAGTYGALSFFEIYTALAFLYFKQQRVDYAVLETGLGGRLDATNVVHPHIVGISSISYDHTSKLGNTLSAIAAEKAGIVKSGTATGIVISAPQHKEARDVIRRRCAEENARLYEVGSDILYHAGAASRHGQVFSITGAMGRFMHVRLPLLGEHQLINASMAVGLAAGAVAGARGRLSLRAVRNGLSSARWPGRFEIVGSRPAIILDGAHNEASAAALAQAMRSFLPGKNIILVLGASKDKDIAGMCRQLVRHVAHCVVTKADTPRGRSTADIARCIRAQGVSIPVMQAQHVAEAVRMALKQAHPSDAVVVTGSLFVVAEARRIIMKKRHA